MRKTLLATIGTYVGLAIAAALFLLPFYLMLRSSLMTTRQINSLDWQWLPDPVTFDNFRDIVTGENNSVLRGLRNSLVIATITAPVSTMFASMCGYALARIPVPGRGLILSFVVATLMIPGAVTFLPTFVVVGSLGGVNTLWGIVAPGLFNAFAVLLFRNFYLRFPAEVEEAGRLDGLSHLGLYFRVLLPNSGAMLAAMGVLSYIEAWNAFLWPLVIGQDPNTWTVQVALSTYLAGQSLNLPGLFAGTVLAILPLVIVFLIAQRHIVAGITMSGVKG